MIPLTEAGLAAAREGETLALRRILTETNGNVTAAAVTLGCGKTALHNRINALNLRAWLTLTYPRSARQPPKKNRRTTRK